MQVPNVPWIKRALDPQSSRPDFGQWVWPFRTVPVRSMDSEFRNLTMSKWKYQNLGDVPAKAQNT
jgi:hypothetical protein